MKVMIACPVRDRDWILGFYLQGIFDINYPKKNIVLYFLVNNSTDHSLEILEHYKNVNKHLYADIEIEVVNDKKVPADERTKEIRREHIYYWLAALRNRVLDKCIKFDCDYVLSCDCDILMQPDTLVRLLAHNEHVVSSLVYNGYLYKPTGASDSYSAIENAWRYPNILLWHEDKQCYVPQVTSRVKMPSKNPYGHLVVTHFTGACILISKEVASKAKYGYFNRGEDAHFCREVIKAGYNIYCDVSLFNYHIMSRMLLQLCIDGLLPPN